MSRRGPLKAIFNPPILYGEPTITAQRGRHAFPQVVALGAASEVDSAIALGRVKKRLLGVASETDTAGTLGRIKTRALGVATEADTAGSFTSTHLIGVASETDTAGTITVAVVSTDSGELFDSIGVAFDDPDFS